MPAFAPHPTRRPAVVTGASAGIGRAVALGLAGAGHPVVLAARREDRLGEVAAEIERAGGEAVALALDLADAESIGAFAATVEREHGPVEILVSNAGDALPGGTLEVDPDDFARQLHVNLLGAQRLVHAIAPGMVARQRGDVVFVTSDVVVRPRPWMAAYVAAKQGLEGLARVMQMELEGTGVRVGIVRPGPTRTEQGTGWPEELVERVLGEWSSWGLMRHPGTLRPAAVADAVLTVAQAPRGTHLTLVEVEPEAPVTERRE